MTQLSAARISPIWIIVAAIAGGIAVALGAYAAHGLEKSLTAQDVSPEDIALKLEQTRTAVQYQMIHAVAILAMAAVGLTRHRPGAAAAWLWSAGCLMFSGGIYSLAIADRIGHWAIVPAGGLCFILGWAAVGLCAFVRRDADAGALR